MAVYTHLAEEEIADFVASYDIGDLISANGIAEGVENSNYLLRTSGGGGANQASQNWILTLFEKRVEPKNIPYFMDLKTHLAGAGLPVPLPLANRAGGVINQLGGRPAVIISFLEGISRKRPLPEHCRQLGYWLAKLHVAGQSFAGDRANDLGPRQWQDLLQSCAPADIAKLHPELGNIISASLNDVCQKWPSKEQIPWGVIHADLFPNNVFFRGNELSGLIDFYFACSDFLAYDLAICLTSWCFEPDHSFNLTKGGAMLQGYQSVRPLQQGEKDLLPLLAQGASLRFLLTRLYDWINTPDGALVTKLDPLEYLHCLRFHQKVRGLGDYGDLG